jgi:hypothetical protein
MKSKVKANQNIVTKDLVKKTKLKMVVYSTAPIITKTDSKLTVKEKEMKDKVKNKGNEKNIKLSKSN